MARILLHDWSGHPFQAELSRELARRGHEVLHLHCATFTSAHGALARRSDDPLTVSFDSVSVGKKFARYSIWRRPLQELVYGVRLMRRVRRFRPDVMIACNDSIFSKAVGAAYLTLSRTPWVFWLQDFYSVAMAGAAEARGGGAGRLIGSGLRRLEAAELRRAPAVVAITEDFLPLLDDWRVDPDRVTVIRNWAPLGELSPGSRHNRWRQQLGLGDAFIYLYAGTLGLKHNPDLLAELAARTAGAGAHVVVVSEGLGADHLRATARDRRLANLHVLDYQPYEDLPLMLAAADVLVVLLAREAGAFSVPSKLLTSLCAERPLLASIPSENLASRIVAEADAGVVVEPEDVEGFLAGGQALLTDDEDRRRRAKSARAYAEEHFDIAAIADRFEHVLEQARSGLAPAGMGSSRPSGGRILR